MIIGITSTEDTKILGIHKKHLFYKNWLLQSHSNIEIILLDENEGNFKDIYRCNGLVFSGGIDLHPKWYGLKEEYPYAPDVFNLKRDTFETDLFEVAKNRIPILGICRGLQLINILQKGTLIQDLGEPLNSLHRTENSLLADKTHSIKVVPKTLLSQIVNQQEGKVNSAHHQAIDQLGEGLEVNAYDVEKNIIEGIEWQNKSRYPFMLAVQWHPERMIRLAKNHSVFSKNIREAFVHAVLQN